MHCEHKCFWSPIINHLLMVVMAASLTLPPTMSSNSPSFDKVMFYWHKLCLKQTLLSSTFSSTSRVNSCYWICTGLTCLFPGKAGSLAQTDCLGLRSVANTWWNLHLLVLLFACLLVPVLFNGTRKQLSYGASVSHNHPSWTEVKSRGKTDDDDVDDMRCRHRMLLM